MFSNINFENLNLFKQCSKNDNNDNSKKDKKSDEIENDNNPIPKDCKKVVINRTEY